MKPLTYKRPHVVAGLRRDDDLPAPVGLAGHQAGQRLQRRAAAGLRNRRQVRRPAALGKSTGNYTWRLNSVDADDVS